MSVPFSNTHLRVPRGLGTVLEGLAREVLRDQPEDIPEYAARHFDALLKQREDSGMDPAEWAAKLEDMYNNNAFKATGAIPGKDSSSASDHDTPQSELEPTDLSFRELGTVEDEGGDQQETAIIDEEIVDSEGVVVFAAELGATERTHEGATAEDEDDSSNPQPEETVVQSTLFQSETPECNQHEANDQVEKAKEEETTEAETSPGGIHESVGHIKGGLDGNAIPKKDSLVEISFEDVPEDEQIEKVDVKQPEEEGSVEVLQSKILEMQEQEISESLNVFSTPHQDELESMGVEKAVHSEGEGMESQHEAFHILKEKVDTHYLNVNDSDDDEKRKGVKTSSSHHYTSKADKENPEDDQNEHNEKIRGSTFHQKEDSEEETTSNNPDYKEDETTDTVGGDKGDIRTEGYTEVGDHSSRVTWSNASTAATEGETLEASVQHLREEKEEGQRTPVEPQPEDAVVEQEVTSRTRSSEAEDLVEEGKIDSETQKKRDAMCEEGSIIPTESTDRPAASQKDSTDPEGRSGDEEECSRPQEEEDIMDIPLDDPEANRAAAKIQAGFRGHMTRKKMKPEDKAEGEERPEDRGQ